jgi:hypothetical protein
MRGGKDRRSQGRVRASSLVKVTEVASGELLGRFQIVDLSGQGIAFRSPDGFHPGTRLWCEVPDYNLGVSVEVCHSSSGLFSRRVGARFASPPNCLD